MELKWLVVCLILWVKIEGNKGCIEEERLGLLEFKASFTSAGYENVLPSWVDEAESNCCEWERVECNSTHVIHLSLSNITSQTALTLINIQINVNVSLFEHFKELRSLNLSFNGFYASADAQANLKKLEVLDLSYNGFDRSILSWIANIKAIKILNVSYNSIQTEFHVVSEALANLQNLEALDLSWNELNGTLQIQDLENLRSLENLDLGGNYLAGIVPPLTNASLSIRALSLKNNHISGSLLDLANLTNLKTLLLSDNYFYGNLHMQDLENLKSLQNLDLGWNKLTGIVPPLTNASLSIRALSLKGNHIGGSLLGKCILFILLSIVSCPVDYDLQTSNDAVGVQTSNDAVGIHFPGLCSLKRLEELNLGRNYIGGYLPSCLYNLTSVRYLDLSDNNFRGHIPSSWLSSLKSAKVILIGNNLFEGIFSFDLFANHSSLEWVDLSSVVKIDFAWIRPFQLQVLVLKNCHLSTIPEFLRYQHKLKAIDLSHNKIQERFPIWLLQNNTQLGILSLRNNSFHGEFHLPSHLTSHLSVLDVSNNNFSGRVQGIAQNNLPNIQYLSLSKNHFQGDFPFLWDDENCELIVLDLSYNNFSGEIHEKVISSCTSLQTLNLSHNKFNGDIFAALLNLTGLRYLFLNSNSFVGSLPTTPAPYIHSLSVLDVSDNGFHGDIPLWMSNNTTLQYANFSYNFFEGKVLCQFFEVFFVDLSYNNMFGTLPSCFNQGPSNVRYINLQRNRLNGSIPHDFVNASVLKILNLRDNNLVGSIPNNFVSFSRSKALLLGGNNLSGVIPKWMCKLNFISLLDLSRNSFSGSIPHCLYNLSFGRLNANNYDPFISSWGIASSVYYSSYISGSPLGMDEYFYSYEDPIIIYQAIELLTKNMHLNYKGITLKLMSALDLSQNKLEGKIPPELGKLSEIHSLNFSHNQLTGVIPATFSNLKALESLDLSHNNLSGSIPSTLIDLNFLSVFSVAFNNLSGRIPEKGQFGTFENTSFEGNPFLCGLQIGKTCGKESPNSSPVPHVEESKDREWHYIDRQAFFASFSGSFGIFFVGVITVLHVNLYWRRRLFYYTEEFVFSCYYFVYDAFSKLLFGRRFH